MAFKVPCSNLKAEDDNENRACSGSPAGRSPEAAVIIWSPSARKGRLENNIVNGFLPVLGFLF